MPYAEGRTYYDADSHVMELGDWLAGYADPEMRDRIRPLYLGGAGALADEAVTRPRNAARYPESSAPLEANVMGHKGWVRSARSIRRNAAAPSICSGSSRNLVFSTFAPTQFQSDDLELLYGGTRAHNRAMVEFCGEDRRLIAVGFVPLADPELARQAAVEAIALGCGAILVPSVPPSDRSPTHPDYRPIWGLLEESGVPFMLHVGGGGRPLRRSFHRNGKPPGHRLPRGRREHPVEGLHGPAPSARDLPRVHGARRHLRTIPRLARWLHRTGRALGRRSAAPPRHRAIDVPEDGPPPSPFPPSPPPSFSPRWAPDEAEPVPATAGQVHAVPDRPPPSLLPSPPPPPPPSPLLPS